MKVYSKCDLLCSDFDCDITSCINFDDQSYEACNECRRCAVCIFNDYCFDHERTTTIDALIDHLKGTTFFTDPASARFHCNYEGGLFEHSMNVFKRLIDLTKGYGLKWNRKESPMIIALAHDMCKIGCYIPGSNGGYISNLKAENGHGDLSVSMVKEVIDITEEEELCIRWHMGMYEAIGKDKEEQKSIANAIAKAMEKYPNTESVRWADMMATHVDEKKEVVG